MSPLHLNIKTLVNPDTVEWECLEFKEGFNQEEIIQSMCALANDINGWGGGHIVLGVVDDSGKPGFPLKGLELDQIDSIQKRMRELSNLIVPPYSPVTWPVKYDDKTLLVIWVPTGDNRPYKAPRTLGKNKEYRYYIRQGSNSVIANLTEERRLIEQSSKTKFESRVHSEAPLEAIEIDLIRSYLNDIKSDLYLDALAMSLPDLCSSLMIAKGTKDALRPLNVGLMFFSSNPERYFSGAYIDVVLFNDDEGTSFIEKGFKGPLNKQIYDSLAFIKNNVIKEKTVKVLGRPDAVKIVNYPYQAIEEAVVNAVYHRSYEVDGVTEVRVFPRYIQIASYPGPLPPVNEKTILQDRIDVREYRNPKVGQFLKDWRLAEERGTGISTIRKEMKRNDSLAPEFDFGDDNTHFLVILRIHPDWMESPVANVAETLSNEEQIILEHTQSGATFKELRKFLPTLSGSKLDELLSVLLNKGLLSQKKVNVLFGVIKVKVFHLTAKGSSFMKRTF